MTDISTIQTPEMMRIATLFSTIFCAGLAADIWLLSRFLPTRKGAINRMRARLHHLPWRGTDAIIMLGALFCTQLMSPMIISLLPMNADGPQSESLAIILQTVLFAGTGLTVYGALLRHHGVTWRAALGFDRARLRTDIGKGLVYYLAMMPALTIFGTLFLTLLRATGVELSQQGVVELFFNPSHSGLLRLQLALMAITVAPVIEEICFRGVLLPAAIRGLGLPVAVVLVSLIFAGIHANLPSLAPLFVVAASCSLGYLATGSLVVAITMHAAFNTISILSILLIGSSPIP